MEEDDDIPELEDLSEELNKIRKQKGQNLQSEPAEIKVNVINEQKKDSTQTKPIDSKPVQVPIQKAEPQKPKDDLDDFGKGFKKGFFRKQHQQKPTQQKPTKQTEKPKVEDLTHIKANPGTDIKTATVQSFNKELKIAQEQSDNTKGLLGSIVDKKNEWLNQELLMKIAQNPNLMRCFMDPRFSVVIQEMQRYPQECMRKYGNNPEFATFIKDFAALMGDHFNKLATNLPGANPNMNLPEVQAILNDPKVTPFLSKLQKEGKIDVEEINRDPYLASKIKVLIDKGILNIKKLD